MYLPAIFWKRSLSAAAFESMRPSARASKSSEAFASCASSWCESTTRGKICGAVMAPFFAFRVSAAADDAQASNAAAAASPCRPTASKSS